MIDTIIPVSEDHISIQMATEFDFDIKKWKSSLTHMENELVFFNRILTTADHNTMTANWRQRSTAVQKQVKTKAEILKQFIIEVTEYKNKLATIEQTTSDVSNSRWIEKHNFLKNRFENFRKDFNTLKLQVLKYT